MKAKVIKNEQQYEAACRRIYELIQQSEQADELDLLSVLVMMYEEETTPDITVKPIEAIKFFRKSKNSEDPLHP